MAMGRKRISKKEFASKARIKAKLVCTFEKLKKSDDKRNDDLSNLAQTLNSYKTLDPLIFLKG